MANNVWDASTDNDGNVAANWSLGWVPKAGDVMVFDSATTNDNCTFSGAVTCDGLAFANTYTGTINFNGHAMGFGTSDFLGANGGSATVNCAASTITCSGNFDNKDIGTWTRGTSTLVLSGSGTFTGSQNLYNVTVSGTYTILLDSEIDAYGTTLTISGALTCNGKLYSRSGNTLTISGTLSGTGNAILQGHTFAEMSGTYSIDDTSMYVGSDIAFTLTGNATLGGDWVIRGNGTATFGPHEYKFTGGVTFNPYTAGILVIDMDANDGDLVFEGDVTVVETTGTVTWTKGTGTITISGASDVELDFNGEAVEKISTNKVAGGIKMTGDVQTVSWDGRKVPGGFDPNGKTITVDGDCDWLGSFKFDSAADCMNGCTWDIGGNFTADGQTLNATAVWYLYVHSGGTAVASGTGEVEYCDASDGAGSTEIDASAGPWTDGGNNDNWKFGAVATPFAFIDRRPKMLLDSIIGR